MTTKPGDGLYTVLESMTAGTPELIRIYTGRPSILTGDKKMLHEIYALLPSEQVRKTAGEAVSKRAIVVDFHFIKSTKPAPTKAVERLPDGRIKLHLPGEQL